MTILEIKDLRQSYGTDTPVLRDISLRVEQGEFVGIIGLSGSGKSTLLRCINRLIDAAAGEVLVPQTLLTAQANGRVVDILKLGGADLRRVRRKIGMIFQQFNIVKRLSVIDNVLCGGLGYQPALKSTLRIFSADERRRALVNLQRVGL
ncbi:MAG TPA: ATP-binding cassette domain-containing protein, partial [Candidatus Limnocylindria bacterium]|nr:ATP-binding cassette domain-containing protein [Candidatus Limnocylindria bacterium]